MPNRCRRVLPPKTGSALHGDLRLGDLDAERWNETDVRALVARCRVLPFVPSRPQLNYDPEEPDRLTIRLRSGQTLVAEEQYPRGAPQNPLSLDEVIEKFIGNASRFREPAADEIDSLENWTELEDLLPLLQILGVKHEP